MYVCFVLNNAFLEVIQSTPLRQAYGTDNDISPMLYFLFYKPVYYLVDETTFPSKSKELCRRWVGVDLWATDIGNAYLEAKMSELPFIIAGPEFGDLEGYMLVIYKALYGLHSSGLRWHECFSTCL
jgi:hypothetical protein